MDGSERRSGLYGAALLRIGGFDLLVLGVTLVPWSLLGISDLRAGLGLTAIRVAAWAIHLRLCLAPALARPGHEDPRSDAELLAADEALGRAPKRFALGYGLGLLLALGALPVLGLLDLVPGFSLSPGEGVASTLTVFAAALGCMWLPRHVLDSLLVAPRGALRRTLARRELAPTPPPPPSLSSPLRVTISIGVALFFGLSGLAYYLHLQVMHEADALDQQLVVERAAARLARGEVEPGVELVAASELPPKLRALRGATELRESVAVFDPERDLVLAAAPLPDGRWVMSEVEPEEALRTFCLWFCLVVLFVIPAASTGLWISARRFSKPLRELAALADRFVRDGELRSLERLDIGHAHELGRLALSFNAMLDNLEQLTDAAEAIAEGDLRVEIVKPGELHDAFRGMLRNLASSVARLRETALDIASAAREIDALTQNQGRAVSAQAAAVQQASDTVSSLAMAAEQIAGAARDVLSDADQAASTTDATVGEIRTLRAETISITELLELIRGIADRSDLLALNGSLEATRAGEAGRGFALVAAEMRRLAERVTGVLDDVRDRIRAIDSAGGSAVEATENSRRLATETADAARMISAFTDQQSEDTVQVAEGMGQLASAVVNATQAVEQTRAAASGLREVASELELLTQGFRLPG